MRRLTALAIVLAGLLPSFAYGHTRLLRAEPAAGTTVALAPRQVELWFSERLERGVVEIRVVDDAGSRVDRDDAALDGQNRKLARATLNRLGDGRYTVLWRVLSVDSHIIRGSFTFQVSSASR